jgi:hypothetical protein
MKKGMTYVWGALALSIFLVGCDGGEQGELQGANLKVGSRLEGGALQAQPYVLGKNDLKGIPFETGPLKLFIENTKGVAPDQTYTDSLKLTKEAIQSGKTFVASIFVKDDNAQDRLEEQFELSASEPQFTYTIMLKTLDMYVFVVVKEKGSPIYRSPAEAILHQSNFKVGAAGEQIADVRTPSTLLQPPMTSYHNNSFTSCIAIAIKFNNGSVPQMSNLQTGIAPLNASAVQIAMAAYKPGLRTTVFRDLTNPTAQNVCAEDMVWAHSSRNEGVTYWENKGLDTSGNPNHNANYDYYDDAGYNNPTLSKLEVNLPAGQTLGFTKAADVANNIDALTGQKMLIVADSKEDKPNVAIKVATQDLLPVGGDGMWDIDTVSSVQPNISAFIRSRTNMLLTRDLFNSQDPAFFTGSMDVISIGDYVSGDVFTRKQLGLEFVMQDATGAWVRYTNASLLKSDGVTFFPTAMQPAGCTNCTINPDLSVRIYGSSVAILPGVGGNYMLILGNDVYGDLVAGGGGAGAVKKYAMFKPTGAVNAFNRPIFQQMTDNEINAMLPGFTAALAADPLKAHVVFAHNTLRNTLKARFGYAGYTSNDEAGMLSITSPNGGTVAYSYDDAAQVYTAVNMGGSVSPSKNAMAFNSFLDSTIGGFLVWKTPMTMPILGHGFVGGANELRVYDIATNLAVDTAASQNLAYTLENWDTSNIIAARYYSAGSTIGIPTANVVTACQPLITGCTTAGDAKVYTKY